jgi:hypothetical protein
MGAEVPMLEFITNLFRKPAPPAVEADSIEPDLRTLTTRSLASSLGGGRHRGCEISGHWTIRGQEVYLEYKRKDPMAPDVSQSKISKAELKGYLNSRAS